MASFGPPAGPCCFCSKPASERRDDGQLVCGACLRERECMVCNKLEGRHELHADAIPANYEPAHKFGPPLLPLFKPRKPLLVCQGCLAKTSSCQRCKLPKPVLVVRNFSSPPQMLCRDCVSVCPSCRRDEVQSGYKHRPDLGFGIPTSRNFCRQCQGSAENDLKRVHGRKITVAAATNEELQQAATDSAPDSAIRTLIAWRADPQVMEQALADGSASALVSHLVLPPTIPSDSPPAAPSLWSRAAQPSVPPKSRKRGMRGAEAKPAASASSSAKAAASAALPTYPLSSSTMSPPSLSSSSSSSLLWSSSSAPLPGLALPVPAISPALLAPSELTDSSGGSDLNRVASIASSIASTIASSIASSMSPPETSTLMMENDPLSPFQISSDGGLSPLLIGSELWSGSDCSSNRSSSANPPPAAAAAATALLLQLERSRHGQLHEFQRLCEAWKGLMTLPDRNLALQQSLANSLLLQLDQHKSVQAQNELDFHLASSMAMAPEARSEINNLLTSHAATIRHTEQMLLQPSLELDLYLTRGGNNIIDYLDIVSLESADEFPLVRNSKKTNNFLQLL